MAVLRNEIITVTAPIDLADRIGELLNESLAKVAKLKRVDDDKTATFSFKPSAGEHWLISIRLSCLSEKMMKTANHEKN